jgi:NAD(P)H dehydrogenase (quinone)
VSAKVQVVFYSMYGHVYQLAEAVAAGAREVSGAEVALYQVPELVPRRGSEAQRRDGDARAIRAHTAGQRGSPARSRRDYLPTRFGNMCAQMRNFLDQTGGLWAHNALVGKVGSVFASTGTQHGGQETTITSFHTTLLHLGMVIVGLPYSEGRLRNMDEISGGGPYGATSLAGADGRSRPVGENELAMARFQGRHVAEIAARLARS